MPLSFKVNSNNPYSLSTLLKKANIIKSDNEDFLKEIKSRSRKHNPLLQFTTPRQLQLCQATEKDDTEENNDSYSESQTSNDGRSHNQHNGDKDVGDDEYTTLVDNTSTNMITSWRYSGVELAKEKIAIDDFIDLKLETFDDLIRLNDQYDKLLTKYSRLLTDEVESRVAVEVVLRNLETLKIAIEEVHDNAIDIGIDAQKSQLRLQGNDHMGLFMKHLSHGVKALSKVSNLCINTPATQNQKDSSTDNSRVINFNSCETLNCCQTFSNHEAAVWALEPYTINGKEYIASSSEDTTIKIWDLNQNELVATLLGHTDSVYALTSYKVNNVQMLASGGNDHTIKIWNLSDNDVKTLPDQDGNIVSLSIYKQGEKHILISGGGFGTVKLWDLDSHNVIKTLNGHNNCVDALSLYYRRHKPYLASGSRDGTIKIWSLTDHSLVTTLGEGDIEIKSMVVLEQENDKKVLASVDHCGYVKLWSLEDLTCTQTFKACSYLILTLQGMQHDGKVCIVCPGDDMTIKVWDSESNSIFTTTGNDSFIFRLKVFMNGDRPCLASAHANGDIKLWME